MKFSTCCNEPAFAHLGEEGTNCYVCEKCNKPCDLLVPLDDYNEIINKNNGIKIQELSKRIRATKNNFSIEAMINVENGKLTIENIQHENWNADNKNVFKFINSKPSTVKAISELLLAISEHKVK